MAGAQDREAVRLTFDDDQRLGAAGEGGVVEDVGVEERLAAALALPEHLGAVRPRTGPVLRRDLDAGLKEREGDNVALDVARRTV